jgi:hypothetical protein
VGFEVNFISTFSILSEYCRQHECGSFSGRGDFAPDATNHSPLAQMDVRNGVFCVVSRKRAPPEPIIHLVNTNAVNENCFSHQR